MSCLDWYILRIFICTGESDSNVTNRGLRRFMVVIIKWSKAIIFLYSQCFPSEITVDICVLGAVSEWSWNNERNVVWIFLGGWHLHKTDTCYIAKNDITFRSRWLAISINCLFWKYHEGNLLTTKNFKQDTFDLCWEEKKREEKNIRLLFLKYYWPWHIYVGLCFQWKGFTINLN